VEAEPAFRTQHANPYNARLYSAVIGEGVRVRDLSYLRLLLRRVDIVHLHWPELTFLSGHRRWRVVSRLALFFTFLRIARLRGTRVVWTVHNVAAHESRSTPLLRRWYRSLLLANVDGILGLTESGIQSARREYPELADVPAAITPHGHYRHDYDFSATRAEARAALGITGDETLVLSVGQIRPYKNVPTLVRTFRAAAVDGARLVIAGKPATAELGAEIADAAAGAESVLVEPTFQSSERMALWLRASDLVVLPYTAIQNSGSAVLALSADRPVLVPAIGAMTELAEQVGEEWVRTYRHDLTPEVLSDALEWARAERPSRPDLSELEWDRIARDTIRAYRTVLATPRPGADDLPGRGSSPAPERASTPSPQPRPHPQEVTAP
jgi:glycosyltransferase involved in cell wall biosynthesis